MMQEVSSTQHQDVVVSSVSDSGQEGAHSNRILDLEKGGGHSLEFRPVFGNIFLSIYYNSLVLLDGEAAHPRLFAIASCGLA
jgi:hypothetical protein